MTQMIKIIMLKSKHGMFCRTFRLVSSNAFQMSFDLIIPCIITFENSLADAKLSDLKHAPLLYSADSALGSVSIWELNCTR